ncbi:nucleoside transporter [bacterium E08(2017)]|nr:nucleoside transporter [bacterium E08(2017)]
MLNLISFAGVFFMMGVGWLLSSSRKCLNWRLIVWGLVFQAAFAAFIFYVPFGVVVFNFVNAMVVKVLGAAFAGIAFLFGPLASSSGEGSVGFVLAFQVLPAIVFFSALMSVLYYLGIMQILIRGFSFLFTKVLNISGAESLCAASNIFVGVESALTIKPHLAKMTKSEFCTVLTVGMATVASTVLAAYIGALNETFPAIAGHLVSASFLSAPAALIMSKLVMPETEKPETLGVVVKPHYEKDGSFFEAVINGANSGVRLVVGVGALLLAVLGLMALVNMVLNGVGWRLNGLMGASIDWSLEGLLGYFFYPFTLMMGVEPGEAMAVSKLIGIRSIATEIPAYYGLSQMISDGLVTGRSAVIATYALCGFAHISSMAIFVGGVCAIVPERTADITRAGFRALIAATLACLMTACIAGAFYTTRVESLLLGN